MARNISDITLFIQDLLRKERGVFITYDQITANLDAAQLDCVEMWFTPYGETQKLHDALRPIREYVQFASNASGMVTFPSDYLHLLGSPFTVTGSSVNEIVFVQESELPFALKSQLRAVSNSYPIAVDNNIGFSIYPQQTQVGFYNYLRRPATPVFGYSQVGRVITYDPTTSTQIEFSDAYINAIIARSLKYAGQYMDEQTVSQFAEIYSQQTQ